MKNDNVEALTKIRAALYVFACDLGKSRLLDQTFK